MISSEENPIPQTPGEETGTPRHVGSTDNKRGINDGIAEPADTKENQTEEQIDNLLFLLEISARYHQRRRAFIDFWHRGFMFLTILAGSAAAADLVGYIKILSFLTAVFAALDLVFALSDIARDHEFLYRRFARLIAEIESNVKPTNEDAASWRKEMLAIDADEPPTFWAVQAVCYNEALFATGREGNPRIPIRLHERMFKNLLHFSSATSQSDRPGFFVRLWKSFR